MAVSLISSHLRNDWTVGQRRSDFCAYSHQPVIELRLRFHHRARQQNSARFGLSSAAAAASASSMRAGRAFAIFSHSDGPRWTKHRRSPGKCIHCQFGDDLGKPALAACRVFSLDETHSKFGHLQADPRPCSSTFPCGVLPDSGFARKESMQQQLVAARDPVLPTQALFYALQTGRLIGHQGRRMRSARFQFGWRLAVLLRPLSIDFGFPAVVWRPARRVVIARKDAYSGS